MPTTKNISVDYNIDSREEFSVSLPSSLDPSSFFQCHHPQTSSSQPLPPPLQSPLTGIFEIESTNHYSSLNRDNLNQKQQQQQQGITPSKLVSIMNPADRTTSSIMNSPIVLNTGSLSITPVNIPCSSSSVSSSSLNIINTINNNNITPPPPLASVYYNHNNNNNNNNNNNISGRENIWSNQEQQLLTITGHHHQHHQYEHQLDQQQQQISSMNSSDDQPNSPNEPRSKKAFIIENINDDSEMSEPCPDSTACDGPNSNNSTNFTISSTGQINAVQFSSGTMGEDDVDMACSFMQKDPSSISRNLPPLSYSRQTYSLQSNSSHNMQIPQQNYYGYSTQQQPQSSNTNPNNNNNNQQSQFGSISNMNSGWQQQQQQPQHEQLRGRGYHNFLNMENVEREKISIQNQQQHHLPPPPPLHAFPNSQSHSMTYPTNQNHHLYHRQVQPLPQNHTLQQQQQTNCNQSQQQNASELDSIEHVDLKPIISPMSLTTSWYNDSYPGGLEHLFKEISEECQKLLMPSDVPDTARFRGYFTVQELLQLKRQILQRHQSSPSGYTYTALSTAEEARQAALRAENMKTFHNTSLSNNISSSSSANNNHHHNNNNDSSSNTENISSSSEVEGTANQVKGALDVLNDDDDDDHLLHEEPLQQQPLSSSQHQQQQKSDSWAPREIPNIQNSNDFSIRSSSCSSTTDITSHGSPYSPVLTIDERPQQHLYNQQQQPQMAYASLQRRQQQQQQQQPVNRRSLPQLAPPPLDREHISVTPDIKCLAGLSTTPSPPGNANYNNNNNNPLPPAYRTSTLVFKLLQIGPYSFRSFTDEPNKLKVQFNAQKLSYECQLPNQLSKDNKLLRKVLFIEVNFDQISKMKFETGKMEIRVEGNPYLECQFIALEESTSLQQTLTPEDQYLLEQISKEQLVFNHTNHNVYFLNERLVQQLEGQFRDHPRFRHLITESDNSRFGQ